MRKLTTYCTQDSKQYSKNKTDREMFKIIKDSTDQIGIDLEIDVLFQDVLLN